MFRYTLQLFAVTVFALGLIWFAGTGEATQNVASAEPILWADTIHIDTQEKPSGKTADSLATVQQKNDAFLRNIRRLQQAAFEIRNQYMEDIDPDQLLKAGITGMLSDLDRFSVLMEKTQYDALMESTHGKYSGLGMQIDARDGRIIIITPIEGTPAYRRGLHAGDIIMSIGDKSTEGLSTSDASKLMRGEAGTSVKLMIQRPGVEETMEFEVERAVIELRSVNYAGMIPGTTIGYVRLSKFAEETSRELREAINALNAQGVTGLVFDLRSNGGGLLEQAIETSELFLPEGKEIVYTKGRLESSERHYKSSRPPIFPDKPLIVLVNEGTASASEIVAGAIQDWDRGIILGNTTYGKGLVQQIFPVAQDGSMQVKLTTAKYYVPSGRCIQKPETQDKDKPGQEDAEEAHPAADSMSLNDKPQFFTNGGRIVYGGGGIVPDVILERELWKPIEINLERKSMFFDFAVKYVAQHPDVKPDFEVTAELVGQFRAFIKEKKFDYKTSSQIALEKLEETIAGDTDEDKFKPQIDNMKTLIAAEKEQDFDESIDYIRRSIKSEIVAAIAGERGVYEQIVLKSDKAVQKAVTLLGKPDEFAKLMTKSPTQKKASVNN